jgi:hypothetical protein
MKRKKEFKAPRTKDGKLACERCLKAEGKKSHLTTKDGRTIRHCENCRETQWREQQFKHGEAPAREIMVMDALRTHESRLAEQFILHQVRAFSLKGVTAYIKIEEHAALRKQAVRVQHFTPPRKAGRGSTKWRPWFEAAIGLRPAVTWPVREEIKIGTAQIKDEVAVELMRKDWYFETEDVEWADAAEALAYGAGVALHKILRKIGQIEGRDVGTEARKLGIRWLAEFRAWRPSNEERRGVQALLASG